MSHVTRRVAQNAAHVLPGGLLGEGSFTLKSLTQILLPITGRVKFNSMSMPLKTLIHVPGMLGLFQQLLKILWQKNWKEESQIGRRIKDRLNWGKHDQKTRGVKRVR